MWNKLTTAASNVWSWLQWAWTKEEFVTWLVPKGKFAIVHLLSLIGTGATAAASYMQNVPLDQIVNAKTLAIALVVVTSLSYWFRNIGDRADARAEDKGE